MLFNVTSLISHHIWCRGAHVAALEYRASKHFADTGVRFFLSESGQVNRISIRNYAQKLLMSFALHDCNT